MELNDVLGVAIKAKASDIHLKPNQKPIFRLNGGFASGFGGGEATAAPAPAPGDPARKVVDEGFVDKAAAGGDADFERF